MTVYVEDAFLVNALLDGLLLYLALKCARARVPKVRLLFAACLGGGEAVAFPLLALPVWAAYPVKFFGGALLVLAVLPKGRSAPVAFAAFFALTFLLGGLLTAVYSFFDVPYEAGTGYLVAGAPALFVIAGAAVFGLLVCGGAKALYRYRKVRRQLFSCTVEAGERKARLTGFADSGDLLTFRGRPVCVISAVGALALFRGREPLGRMTVSTVLGSRDSPVFCADCLRIGGNCYRDVCFTVGEVPSREYSVILHTAFTEGRHEDLEPAEKVAAIVRGE